MTIQNVKCRSISNFKFYIVILIFDFYIFNFLNNISPPILQIL